MMFHWLARLYHTLGTAPLQGAPSGSASGWCSEAGGNSGGQGLPLPPGEETSRTAQLVASLAAWPSRRLSP